MTFDLELKDRKLQQQRLQLGWTEPLTIPTTCVPSKFHGLNFILQVVNPRHAIPTGTRQLFSWWLGGQGPPKQKSKKRRERLRLRLRQKLAHVPGPFKRRLLPNRQALPTLYSPASQTRPEIESPKTCSSAAESDQKCHGFHGFRISFRGPSGMLGIIWLCQGMFSGKLRFGYWKSQCSMVESTINVQ